MPDGDDASTYHATEDRTGRFGEVFSVREFQVLWLAITQSAIGDQLAKVALSILVFSRTGSPFLAAATYGVTYLPFLLAGPLLAPLADRYPRRAVLIMADLIRGTLVAFMVIPGMPLWGLFVLVFLVGLARPPFEAARAASLPDMLPGDLFVVGSAVTQTTNQITQVVGFAVGGLAVAAIGAPWTLALNSASFFLGALLFRVGMKRRPAAGGSNRPSFGQVLGNGTRTIFGNPRMRALIGLGMLAGFYITPEVLAVPYVLSELHLDNAHAGVLLACGPLGISVGTLLLTRLVRPSRRIAMFGPLAILGLLLLVPFWLVPSFPAACVLIFLSGMAGGYNLAVNQVFVSIVPNTNRGQAMGLAQTMLVLTQGLSTVISGALANAITSAATIAIGGAVGAVLASWLWFVWVKAQRAYDAGR